MRAKFIINPSSGKEIVQKSLDRIIGKLILDGTISHISVYKTRQKHDAYEEAKNIIKGEYDLIVSVGGDGTLNEVVNGVIEGEHHTPIAILPAGTVNDFAEYLRLPRSVDGFCKMIRSYKVIPVDAGKIDGKYFINVAAGGMLTDIGYKVPTELKTVLGKFAYYATGVRDLPKQIFESFSLDIDSKDFRNQEDALMFIITNTPSVGGFKRLAPMAKIDDGLLDVFILTKTEFFDLLPLFVQLVTGEHIKHPNIRYFQTNKLTLNCLDVKNMTLDLDGEQGEDLPAVIEVVPKAVRILVPSK